MHLRHLIAFLFTAPALAATPPISNVFQVDQSPYPEYRSSCAPVADLLDTIWQQIHDMNENAIDALSAAKYNHPEHSRTRKVVWSYWAIAPKDEPNQRGFEYSAQDVLGLQDQGEAEPARTFWGS